ncbi:MAG: hypothetical protein QOG76_2058 [Pseudonocardiales bacterium]|nr:hypothetical protein [Pseudonocardiales bacterium]
MTAAVPAWLTQVTKSLLDGLDARLGATGTPAWAPTYPVRVQPSNTTWWTVSRST